MIVVPSQMGRLNQRALVAGLQRLGVASRADLAKALGLSQPTAGRIVDELLAAGVLEEAIGANGERPARAPRRGRSGRPGRMLRLDRAQPRFVGIRLGVSTTGVVLLPVGAPPEDEWNVEFRTARSIAGWVRELRRARGRLRASGLWGVLVSVPGVVDEGRGRVVFSPNLHWTEGVDLRAEVESVWGLPVALVQEERALALGCQAFDRRDEDFLLVDFGDGVGGAVVTSGRLYAAPLPIHGELGHTPVLGNGRRCGCGATGCLETLASQGGLLQSFAEARRCPGTWPDLVRWVNRHGLAPWLEEALDATAVVIAGALNVLGIRRVVLTGAIAELGAGARDRLGERIRAGAMWARFGSVVCEVAPRRRNAGLVAAGIDRFVVPVSDSEQCGAAARKSRLPVASRGSGRALEVPARTRRETVSKEGP